MTDPEALGQVQQHVFQQSDLVVSSNLEAWRDLSLSTRCTMDNKRDSRLTELRTQWTHWNIK